MGVRGVLLCYAKRDPVVAPSSAQVPGWMLPCRAAEELALLPVPVEMLLPHSGTTLAPEEHGACEPELSILLFFMPLPPSSFSQTVNLNQIWQRQEFKYEPCANLVGIWVMERSPEDPCTVAP